MRKICPVFTILVLIALCLFLLPTQSQAADIPGSGVCGENLIFTYLNDLLLIQGNGPMTNFDYENKAPWEIADSPIKRIIIYEGVTSIGDYAFSSCTQLEELTLPSTLTQIGKNAFTGCSLNTLVLPDSVESIGSSAFSYCDNLTELTLSSGLKTIGESAFYNCLKLQNVIIPANVSKIENSAFSACTSLTKIQVDPSNTAYTSDDNGVLFGKDLTVLMQMPGGFIGSYTIPNTVTTISDRAFYTCSSLTALSIPDSVTAIGDAAFKYCSKLAFNKYGNAKYLGNPENPYMVLVSVATQTAAEYPISADTKFICDRAFEKCTNLKSITIPDSVIYLGGWAFSRCAALTDVTIGNGLTQIKSNTFQECGALTTAKLGAQISTIDEQAFYGCFTLQSINFPRSLITISRLSFAGCIGLTSVIIPDSITLIDLDAFAYCQNLTSIIYCGTEAQWEKYKVGFYSVPLENIQVSYHAFTEVSCTTPSTCTYCELIAAEALGHTPGAEATETTDQICTVCGEVLAPAFGVATVPATTPSTSTSASIESNPDPEEDGSNDHVIVWIIVGIVITAGAAAGGFFLYKKYKLQILQILQKLRKPQE